MKLWPCLELDGFLPLEENVVLRAISGLHFCMWSSLSLLLGVGV